MNPGMASQLSKFSELAFPAITFYDENRQMLFDFCD